MSNIPILGEKPDTDLGPQIRLLLCGVCSTIEELPDYEGRPDNDHLLEISVSKHRNAAGTPHTGALMKVPLKFWANPEVKKQIIDQIRNGTGGMSEFDSKYYETRSTFAESALKCYGKHNRPKGACHDWQAPHKLLRPDTSKARKELGLAPLDKTSGPKTYECSFCPVAVYMRNKANDAAGL